MKCLKMILASLLVLALTGCTTIYDQQKVAEKQIKLTGNPAEVAGCQTKGMIIGLVNGATWKVFHAGDWIVGEVKNRGGNTLLLPPTGAFNGRVWFSGEAYSCPPQTK